MQIDSKKVFEYFEKISQIPRCSGDEQRISNYLVDFAKKRNLEYIQDDAFNVIIKKEASEGFENSTPVIIQGHMDMVCVKEDGSDHNFDTDPIKIIKEGDYLKTDGTTLGADNGIAVAIALAILDSDQIKHPALEVLITTNEETTMAGAASVDGDKLNGKILLNIDSEEEGVFTLGSAGGATVEFHFDAKKEKLEEEGLRITVEGLLGGHSGMEIKRQRANAIKILARVLDAINHKTSLRIAKINAGSKHNAIPSFASVDIYVEDKQVAEETFEKISDQLVDEYQVEDPGMEISLSKVDLEEAVSEESSKNLIDFAMLMPDGVISMSKDMEGLVEASINNAIISEGNGEIIYEVSLRSAKDSKYKYIMNILKILSDRIGIKMLVTNSYPSWEFEKDNKLKQIAEKTYKEMFGKEPSFEATHGGLECGMLKSKLKDCEMISYGPNIYDCHSPKERLSISSVENIWNYTLKLLEDLK
jgi:dipeptidase D